MAKQTRASGTSCPAFFTIAAALAFAVPEAFAQQDDVFYVSAANPQFNNTFAGGQVVEVAVYSPMHGASDAFREAYEPVVTVNDRPLMMTQAPSGVWYGYFANENMVKIIHGPTYANYGIVSYADNPYSDLWEVGYAYGDERSVLSNPGVPERDVLIQAFTFGQRQYVDVVWQNCFGCADPVRLVSGDAIPYADVAFDKEVYPLGSPVHVTITDPWLNIDPTAKDVWVLTHDNKWYSHVTDARLYEFIESGHIWKFENMHLTCVGCAVTIDAGPLGQLGMFLQDNADSLDDIWNLDPLAVTIVETRPNSGIFANTDAFGVPNLVTTEYAGANGKNFTMSYNGNEAVAWVGSKPGGDPAAQQSSPRYVYAPAFAGMEGYSSQTDILEIDTHFPFENLALGDVIRYRQCDPDCADSYDAGRVTDVRPGYVAVLPDNPGHGVEKTFVTPNMYAGIVNTVVACSADDMWRDDGGMSYVDGTRVVTEFANGTAKAFWPGKWVHDNSRFCNLDHIGLDAQERVLKYLKP